MQGLYGAIECHEFEANLRRVGSHLQGSAGGKHLGGAGGAESGPRPVVHGGAGSGAGALHRLHQAENPVRCRECNHPSDSH